MLLYPGTRLTACFFLLFFPFCFEMLAAYYIMFWFAVQVIEGYFAFNSNIAFFAHAGGFLAGIAMLPLVADETRLRLLKRLSRGMRLLDIISFLTPHVERRGLSPGTKTVFLTLAGVLLAGTAAAYAYSASQQSLLAAYNVDWRLGGIEGSNPAFVGIVEGSAYPILAATHPVAQVVVNILHDYDLLYNPDLAGRELLLAAPQLRPLRVRVLTTLYTPRSVTIEPRLIEARFNKQGVLAEAKIDALIRTFIAGIVTTATPLDAVVTLESLADPTPLLRLMAFISMLTVAVSIYVVAYRDEEYVITPEE
jgi:hypothetical protein